ncbi:610_t:CDS:1, partial [Ambispora gerdemannii]
MGVKMNLIEVKRVYTRAQAVANLIASQLKKRLSSRLVIRNVLTNLSLEREVKGVKIQIGGRLDGSENTQKKKIVQGKMPLSTNDSNIEVGQAEATDAYGKIGVK